MDKDLLQELVRRARRKVKQIAPRFLVDKWQLRSHIRQEPEIGVILPLIRRNSIAVDAGAHSGRYTLALSSRARRVIAFEPIPELAERLRQHFGSRVDVHNVALGTGSSTATFFIPERAGCRIYTRASLKDSANPGFDHEEITVEVRALDVYGLENVGFIKIDVEGNEFETVEGAVDTIAGSRPPLMIEIDDRHNPGRLWETINYVRDMKYDAYFYHERRLKPASEFNVELMQNIANLKDPFGSARGLYISNFIFIPK